jgi:hypothetical protein
MPTTIKFVRKIISMPSSADILFANRGFPGASSTLASRLEQALLAILKGFEYGVNLQTSFDVVESLDRIDPFYRGLAYEGAAAGLMLHDIVAMGRANRAQEFLRGPGAPHSYMAYIGYGLLMRRLPRVLWQRAMPDLDVNLSAPKLSWLAIDAYGFDHAYFDTKQWVNQQYTPKPYPFEGSAAYFQRAVDQGVGRALYFIHGGRIAPVADAVLKFPEPRRADLWSGVGAAVSYLGGPSFDELRTLGTLAGPHGPDLAVGTVFASKARHHAGYVPTCTQAAASVYCGMSADDAASLADSAAIAEAAPTPQDREPEYEQWRQRIKSHFIR